MTVTEASFFYSFGFGASSAFDAEKTCAIGGFMQENFERQ